MTATLNRRHLLAAALATGVAVPLGGTGRAWAAAPGRPRLTLPPSPRFPEIEFLP
jgi:hypothetical protein